jgi:hypothetical protein
MKSIGLIVFLFTFFCISLSSQAQQMTLEKCDSHFNEQLDLLKSQYRERVQTLQGNYLAALLRFESNARMQGNLEDVQAARLEIEQVEADEEGRNIVPSDNERIKNMQEIRAQQLKSFADERARGVMALVDAVKFFAENTSRELTRDNQIDKAVKWNDWLNTLEAQPDVVVAMRTVQQQRQNKRVERQESSASEMHQALRGEPIKLLDTRTMELPDGPRAYLAGNEPDGSEKQLANVRPPSASGIGNTVLTGTIKLIEEDNTLASSRSHWSNYSRKGHLHMPRLEFSPLIGKPMGRSLVVFDLFKRGSGTRREVIRTESILLPPLDPDDKVVVDAQPYEYESERYRSQYSNYRSDRSTEDQFYGYIVTIFDENGELIFQRTTERALNEYARKSIPR